MSKKNKKKWWGSHVTTPSKETEDSDTFTCSVDGVTACSKAPKSDILIDSRLWQSIVGLCERFDTEWMAYLVGHRRQDGDYEVTKLTFPEQSAGGAYVHNQPEAGFTVEPGTFGVIHSHVGMQAFFSKTDKDHANWPVEIVVNRKGEYEVSLRVQLPCGDWMRRSARVMLLTGGILDGLENTLKEALKKGEEKEKAKQPVVVWSGGRGDFSGYGSSYGYGGGMGAYYASRQEPFSTLLGGKYRTCPICSLPATGTGCCSHTLKEMEAHEDKNKGVAP